MCGGFARRMRRSVADEGRVRFGNIINEVINGLIERFGTEQDHAERESDKQDESAATGEGHNISSAGARRGGAFRENASFVTVAGPGEPVPGSIIYQLSSS